MFTRKFNEDIALSMMDEKMIVEKLDSTEKDASFTVNDGKEKLKIKISDYEASDNVKLEEGQELITQNKLYDFDFVNASLIDAYILGYQKVYGSVVFYANILVFKKDNKILKLVSRS